MISYAPLMATLHKKGMSKSDLQKAVKTSSATIAKISKDQYISMKILDDICRILNCRIEEVIEYINEENRQEN
ncbi:helix-turn-helix transcriptional regulator [Schinkia azotoformans]|uniref:XRE family transcriptional regulator n=1 Tax=Schinkia azotoformans LMG 9581 TaxID=1131731 RepID=K6D6G0_SCHAZ|nr:helix-turn-helix transcriptional regulator [Schinkia azotoformans]EKN68092.1 XRE family transcriptional regulator [Schinkia azotoformans LMG 9581]MEC1638100.1 helix-turn-helix transcriptional regulator [Schinkia azotoformans]MEC1946466.1 helix-turn-helix transcriptional regulator [Schinkia azotoformans]